jgi:uncharacterized protein (TIGR00725 family)
MDKRYKIAVSGAAETRHCCKNIEKLGEQLGQEIVRQGCILITGATTGVPYFSAKGAKKVGGVSIGFSPAASEKAHQKAYRLPTEAFDVIVYTGFDYSGRNLLMTRAADAVIIVCGRMGTLNEFTIAFEDQKPIGVLVGSGGTADKIESFIQRPFRGKLRVVYDRDPKRLIAEVIKLIKKDKGR